MPFTDDHHFILVVDILKKSLFEGVIEGGILYWINLIHEGYVMGRTFVKEASMVGSSLG
jgi:hypothetical protein